MAARAGSSGIPDFDKWVKGNKGSWNDAKEAARNRPGFGASVPDGRYHGRLAGAEIVKSQSSNRLQIVWSYAVTEGEYEGETVNKYQGLEGENMDRVREYLAAELLCYGVDLAPEDLGTLPAVLEQLVEEAPELDFRVHTKGEYTNIYISTVERGGNSEDEEPTEEGEEVVEEEAAPAEATLEVGLKVMYPWQGEDVEGEIAVLDPDGDESKVKVDSINAAGKKVRRTIPLEGMYMASAPEEEAPEEEEVIEEEEAPAPKPAAKPAARKPATRK
jgi:hypothetical protein